MFHTIHTSVEHELSTVAWAMVVCVVNAARIFENKRWCKRDNWMYGVVTNLSKTTEPRLSIHELSVDQTERSEISSGEDVFFCRSLCTVILFIRLFLFFYIISLSVLLCSCHFLFTRSASLLLSNTLHRPPHLLVFWVLCRVNFCCWISEFHLNFLFHRNKLDILWCVTLNLVHI